MRPLAFSTLGMPGAPVEEVLSVAREYGCAGVELRCADGELITPDTDPAALGPLRAAFLRADVEVVAVCAYTRVARDSADDVLHHVRLAAALGAPFVRVFGGVEGQDDPAGSAVKTLTEVAERLPDNGVRVVLETHDVFLTGGDVAGVLERVGSPRIGALWDLVNPWRAGEPAAETADRLAPYLMHVQVKDAASPRDLAPVLPGKGAIGVRGVLSELDRIGYAGYLALEWERMWYPDAAPVQEALAAFREVVTP